MLNAGGIAKALLYFHTEELNNFLYTFFLPLVIDSPVSFRYGHKEEVQVRLLFLTCVFSSAGSPDRFSKLLHDIREMDTPASKARVFINVFYQPFLL